MKSIVLTTGRPPPIVRRPARLPLSRAPPPSADGVPCGDRIDGLLTVDRRQASQGGDASTIEAAEFGQFGDAGGGDDRADAGHGAHMTVDLGQGGIGFDDRAHPAVGLGSPPIEQGDQALDIGTGLGIGRLLQSRGFLVAERHQLAAACRLGLQRAARRVVQRLGGRGPQALAEFGKHACIDAVGLAADAHRLGEVVGLAGIDPTEADALGFRGMTQQPIVAPARP